MSDLVLGTAQFGLDYGVTNRKGKISPTEVEDILSIAERNGVTTLDTAAAYGDAETVLAEVDAPRRFRLVTKIAPKTAKNVTELIGESLTRLNVSCLDTLLLHSFDLFKQDSAIWPALLNARSNGLAEKVGVSLYYPEEWDILKSYCERNGHDYPDAVQLPISVFDQRFWPVLNQMSSAGVEVFARSLFLQGIGFCAENQLPEYFGPIGQSLGSLGMIEERTGLSRPELLMGFPISLSEVGHIVIGVDGVSALTANLEAFARAREKSETLKSIDWPDLAVHDESLLIPMNWPATGVF